MEKDVHINEANNWVFKIADVVENDPHKLDIIYLSKMSSRDGEQLDAHEVLTSKRARIYIIVSDGNILKIGMSSDKYGIKHTLDIYRTGGVTGSPSKRSVGCYYALRSEIEDGHHVEIYLYQIPTERVDVESLLKTYENQVVNLDPKFYEDRFKEDYINKVGRYPKLNKQENHEKWSPYVYKIFNMVNNKTTNGLEDVSKEELYKKLDDIYKAGRIVEKLKNE